MDIKVPLQLSAYMPLAPLHELNYRTFISTYFHSHFGSESMWERKYQIPSPVYNCPTTH